MFLGEYRHTLDAKGRVSLPRKFRSETGDRVVVSKGLDGCLFVSTEDGYAELLASVMASGTFDRNGRKVRRHFTGGANPVDIDAAGRVGLTPALREWAGLKKDVVVIGAGDRIEIWDAVAWDAYVDESAESIEDAAEELARQGIL